MFLQSPRNPRNPSPRSWDKHCSWWHWAEERLIGFDPELQWPNSTANLEVPLRGREVERSLGMGGVRVPYPFISWSYIMPYIYIYISLEGMEIGKIYENVWKEKPKILSTDQIAQRWTFQISRALCQSSSPMWSHNHSRTQEHFSKQLRSPLELMMLARRFTKRISSQRWKARSHWERLFSQDVIRLL